MGTPSEDVSQQMRALPSVDGVAQRVGRGQRSTDVIREVLDGLRESIRNGCPPDPMPDEEMIVAEVLSRMSQDGQRSYRRCVNGTGIFLHTGLGRAPLASAAAEAVQKIADGFCEVEVSAASGDRNNREEAVLDDLRDLTGAESATVVNNNAAAVLLALHALAGGREVLVSRGELVEIGGGFRIPDIMSLSGANLVEVGTTNRTYVRDFDRAVNSETALMLSVHTSNYRVVGFQHSPDRGDLVALASEREIPLLEDIGSGLLSSVVPDLLAAEPNARDAIEAGVDLVCFSGDKLLGGPQAGILVGREDLIRRCREDAFFRPSRPDRLCLAALGATLRLHIEDPQAVPVLFALNQPSAQRLDRARHLVRLFRGRFPEATFEAVETHGEVGSGSAPTKEVRSASVEITWPGLDADALASQLRKNSPSVYGRVWRSKFQLDVFAFLPGDDERVEEALSALDQEG